MSHDTNEEKKCECDEIGERYIKTNNQRHFPDCPMFENISYRIVKIRAGHWQVEWEDGLFTFSSSKPSAEKVAFLRENRPKDITFSHSTPPSEVSTEEKDSVARKNGITDKDTALWLSLNKEFGELSDVFGNNAKPRVIEFMKSVREEAKREVLQEILDFGGDSDEAYQLVLKLKESYLRQ
jgi:hypothetical protein